MELVSKINMRGGDLSDIPLIILCVLICIFHSILYFMLYICFYRIWYCYKKLVTMERALVIQLLYERTMISKKYF